MRASMTEVDIHVELTARIVAAYVKNNAVPIAELPAIIRAVYQALREPPSAPHAHKRMKLAA
jgi:predicted transcriptional regulator